MSVYDGALTALDVEEGYNEIVMRYFTPGLLAGCVVTLLSLAGVLLLLKLRWRRAAT